MMASGSKLVGFRGLLLMRGEENGVHCDERADMVAGLPANENWPKLPAGVSPGQLVKTVGDHLEAAPAAPPRVAGRLDAPPDAGRAARRADRATGPSRQESQTGEDTWLDGDSWLDDTAGSDRVAAAKDPEWVSAGDGLNDPDDADGVAAAEDPEWVSAGDDLDEDDEVDDAGGADGLDVVGDADDADELGGVGKPAWVSADGGLDAVGDADDADELGGVGKPAWVSADGGLDVDDEVDAVRDTDEVGGVGAPQWASAGGSPPEVPRARPGALGAPRPHSEREHRNRRLAARARAVAHSLSP